MLATPMRGRTRRGYTLLEVAVVFAIMAILATAGYFIIGQGGGTAPDVDARASLVHLERMQAARPDAPLTDPETLSSLDPSRSYGTTPSTGPDQVSVERDALDPSRYGAAAATGSGDCWLLARDYETDLIGEYFIWAVSTTGVCDAAQALQLQPDQTGETGRSVDRPRQL